MNTISFLNVPLSKITDPNISVLLDVVTKLKSSTSANLNKKDFLPYNKSILTRIIAP